MASRRVFLQALATTSALALSGIQAATLSGPRIAMVIGNARYRRSPLLNPVNDAKAIAGLLREAGLAVDSLNDVPRDEMMNAIERFGAAARSPGTRQAFFYYAGHGVQLDWSNYLLPVDAQVDTREQVKSRCVELAFVMDRIGNAKDRTVIVILDACRNDPFGGIYKPDQKGLSQFDAPAGSLLAYSTGPGKIASDGTGKHGLYTENLVRELAVRRARIEDALKRVRLNVRLMSGGAQIPWETTSLESDVFLFEGERRPLSEGELEEQLESDIAAWNGIKASRNVDDWVAYLRNFPNGRFAEIAQLRLTRLLLPIERTSVDSDAKAAASGSSQLTEESVPHIANDDEYDALPKGAIYIDPAGVKRRKSQ